MVERAQGAVRLVLYEPGFIVAAFLEWERFAVSQSVVVDDVANVHWHAEECWGRVRACVGECWRCHWRCVPVALLVWLRSESQIVML